jgi:hypothetical protein
MPRTFFGFDLFSSKVHAAACALREQHRSYSVAFSIFSERRGARAEVGFLYSVWKS